MLSYIRNKRYAAGNLCLILFTAFILTILSGTVGPVSSAYAANPSVSNTFDATTGEWGNTTGSKTITKGEKIDVNLNVVPVTNPSYSTILVRVYQGLTKIGNDIQLTLTKVYNQVYGHVYQLVYNTVDLSNLLDGNYTVSFLTYGKNSGNYQFDLALTINKPPETPGTGGGGGGGGAFTPPTQTWTPTTGSNTPVTSVVVDNAKGSTNVAIDTAKAVASLPPNGGILTIALPAEAPKATNPAETTFSIEPSLVSAAMARGTGLVFDSGLGIPVLLPAGNLNPTKIQEQLGTSDYKLEVTTGKMTEQESAALASQGSTGTLASRVVNLNITAVSSDGKRVALQVPVRIEMGYTVVQTETLARPLVVKNAIQLFGYETKKVVNEDKLGVYRYNELSKKWDYVGGKVDKTTKQIAANVPSFGKYGVFEYQKYFSDVPASYWANTEVEVLASRHVVRGVTDTDFAPDANVTRAQFTAFLIRALGIQEDFQTASVFTDVPAEWRGVVMAAHKSGLANGYGNGLFKPNQNITRQEMAAMITRVMEARGVNQTLTDEQVTALLAGFSDASKIGSYAREAAAKAINAGIVSGRTSLVKGKVFAPEENATRAESAVMLMRMLKKTGDI